MCKFTNRLFVFSILLCIINVKFLISGAPLNEAPLRGDQDDIDFGDLIDVFKPTLDYDLHYDQRQKGEENLRLKLDGFFVGMTGQDSLSSLVSDDLLENLGEELLIGLAKDRTPSTTPRSVANYLAYKIENHSNQENINKENDFNKFGTVIVEIPAPQKSFEGRHRSVSPETHFVADQQPGTRTKFRLYHLLNLMKRSRKN